MPKPGSPFSNVILNEGLSVLKVMTPNFLTFFYGSFLNYQGSFNLLKQCALHMQKKRENILSNPEGLSTIFSLASGEKPWMKAKVGTSMRLACFYKGSPCAGRMGLSSPPAALLLESQPMHTDPMLPSEPLPWTGRV